MLIPPTADQLDEVVGHDVRILQFTDCLSYLPVQCADVSWRKCKTIHVSDRGTTMSLSACIGNHRYCGDGGHNDASSVEFLHESHTFEYGRITHEESRDDSLRSSAQRCYKSAIPQACRYDSSSSGLYIGESAKAIQRKLSLERVSSNINMRKCKSLKSAS